MFRPEFRPTLLIRSTYFYRVYNFNRICFQSGQYAPDLDTQDFRFVTRA